VTESTKRCLALLRLLPRVSRRLTALLGATVLTRAMLPVGLTIASGVLIGSVPAAIEKGLDSRDGHRLVLALALAGVFFVADEVMAPVLSAVAETLGRRVDGVVRARAMEAALHPAGIRHLEDPAVLDLASMAKGAMDGNFTPGAAVLGVAWNGAAFLSSAASAVLVARFNVALAIGLLLAWRVVRLALMQQFLKQVTTLFGQAQHLRRSAYFRDLALTPAAAKEARIFGLASWVQDRFTEHWDEGMAEIWRTRKGGRAAVFGVIVGITAANLIAFLLIGRAALDGRLQIGELTILLSAVIGIGNLSISQNDVHIAYGLSSLSALTSLEDAVAAEENAVWGTHDAAGLPADAIRFERVGFRYPGRAEAVLDDLDLTIPAGKSTAIVGQNGAGKTTLVKLLCRLYEPTAGQITVDGQPLAELRPSDWQRRLAAIFQDFIRYELPVADNVAFGAPDLPLDEERIAAALDRAGARAIVDRLPAGSATTLSRRFAEGVDLSGGEWQRIALARALYAVDAGAGVLVLDEPTANLDVRAEAELYDRFLDLTRGLTTIVISHRFSTVRRADQIVVIEQGRVVEQGDHDSLVAAGGRYAEMFRLQASRFAEEVS
jgi:ABC-type multidrug transport system fused ATPase/permease subunit